MSERERLWHAVQERDSSTSLCPPWSHATKNSLPEHYQQVGVILHHKPLVAFPKSRIAHKDTHRYARKHTSVHELAAEESGPNPILSRMDNPSVSQGF